MARESSPEDRRKAAKKRLSRAPAASAAFEAKRYGPRHRNSTVVVSARFDQATIDQIASYGNNNNLTLSESVRALVLEGLKPTEAT